MSDDVTILVCEGLVLNISTSPTLTQLQTIKTAIDSAKMLLRIDDIVSGISKKRDTPKPKQGAEVEDHENVDSERMMGE